MCARVEYAVWVHMTRDIRPAAAGARSLIDFTVSGLDRDAFALTADEVGRTNDYRRGCFLGGIGTDSPEELKVPTAVGARVRLTVREYDPEHGAGAWDSKVIGSLSTVVPLRTPYPRPAADGYGKLEGQADVGC